MHAGGKEKQKQKGREPANELKSLSGPRFAEIILPRVQRLRMKMSPFPTLSPSPVCGTPSVVSIYWQL